MRKKRNQSGAFTSPLQNYVDRGRRARTGKEFTRIGRRKTELDLLSWPTPHALGLGAHVVSGQDFVATEGLNCGLLLVVFVFVLEDYSTGWLSASPERIVELSLVETGVCVLRQISCDLIGQLGRIGGHSMRGSQAGL